MQSGPGYVPEGGIPESQSPTTSGYWALGAPVPGYTNLYNLELHNTGSGFVEKFLFSPAAQSTHPAPALVVFHRYSTSHFDAVFWTNFLNEAQQRNWHFIAPLSAFTTNFGCLEGQINTRAVLEYLRPLYSIDEQRVYGVGFSMGAGALATQAARQCDPSSLRFAAIVDHTGSVSLSDVYANSPGIVRTLLAQRFGGKPELFPFAYARCSVLDHLPSATAPANMSRNLTGTPTLLWMADHDPNGYLQDDTRALRDQLLSDGGAARMSIVPASIHSWNTLDDHAVCEWLWRQAPLPAHRPSGMALADADGAWFDFRIEQDQAGAFTPFRWETNPAANQLALLESENLKRVHVDVQELGLSYSGALLLDLAPADGTGDEVVLEGIPGANPPQTVQRNGSPSSYTYDPQLGTLTLPVAGSSPDHWEIQF
ncbi:MAG: hypothetical protein IPJ19_21350 [Planctomycetes bacterium]|nr:hypothetical protein [Planctomycetota bacterium]